ncbi:CGNR zinc finger domain-containing protein [Streptomyces poonensis]|uniref:CGNR zinc finger domain-containing protein n=1 Tax=Streptomyces poonensis TaxID=68255 RepID=UPI003570D751
MTGQRPRNVRWNARNILWPTRTGPGRVSAHPPRRRLRPRDTGDLAEGTTRRRRAGEHQPVPVPATVSEELAPPAEDLLADARALSRVRRCAGQGRGWFSLDRSRNGDRPWCSSNDCGTRDRARPTPLRTHPACDLSGCPD